MAKGNRLASSSTQQAAPRLRLFRVQEASIGRLALGYHGHYIVTRQQPTCSQARHVEKSHKASVR